MVVSTTKSIITRHMYGDAIYFTILGLSCLYPGLYLYLGCRDRPPYFGYVRRSMNRPPQPADSWHKQHEKDCGGSFTKISEPKGKEKNSNDSKRKRGDSMQKTIKEAFSKKVWKEGTVTNNTASKVIVIEDESPVPTRNGTLDRKPRGNPPRYLQTDPAPPSIISTISFPCPICNSPGFNPETINDHIDTCIQ